jgi:hypothetical protein
MHDPRLRIVEMKHGQLRLASVAGLALGFLSLFLIAVGGISHPFPCLISGSGPVPAGFTCDVSYPDGGAPLLVISDPEFLTLLVGSALLVLVSSIAVFYSLSRSRNSPTGQSSLK